MASKIMYENLKNQLDGHLKAAREVTDRAMALGREMTADEGELAADHITKARELAGKVKALGEQLAHEDAVGLQVKGISDRIGGMPGGNYTPAGYGGGTAAAVSPAKGWADAVTRRLSDGYRFKGVVESGSVLVPVPAPQLVSLGQPAVLLRQVIGSEPSAGVYQYLRQVTRTNNAAVVPVGGLKPTSIYETEYVQDRTRTVAHVSDGVPRQHLADAPALATFIGNEMYVGVERALESEILTGDGSGEHMTGLSHTSGVQTVSAPGTGEDQLTVIRRGITSLEQQGLQGSAVIMNPSEWEAIELLRSSTGLFFINGSNGNAPVDTQARRLWGIPVVASPSCPTGVAWLLEATSTRLFVTEEVMLAWSEAVYRPDALGTGVGASDWQRNLVSWRAELRAGFAVQRPSGCVKVALR